MIELPEIPSGSNVVGIGIDQIEVERIQESIERHGSHFVGKIFTDSEQRYCREMTNPAPHYAARFAAKEAVAKALGTGFGRQFGWLDSEIVHGSEGEPIMNFSKKGFQLLNEKGAKHALVSLTHLNSIASSAVLLVSA